METQVSSMRRPCFRAEDDGLASIAGFSGNNSNNNNNCIINHGYPLNHHLNHTQNQPFLAYNGGGVNGGVNGVGVGGGGGGSIMMRRRNSLRNISSLSSPLSPSSPRSARHFDASPRFDEVHSPHFLESCFLCKKPLGGNRDIFMYRGDTPFCSEECRQEQIDMDEAKENSRKVKALRSKKDAAKSSASSSSSPSKARNYPFRTGTVVAA